MLQNIQVQHIVQGRVGDAVAGDDHPSNLLREFQRFGFENHFGAGGLSYLGYGIGLLRVKSSPGIHQNPPFGPLIDSTVVGVRVSVHPIRI